MKKVRKFVVGGIQNKLFNLAVVPILLVIGAFMVYMTCSLP